MNQGERPWRQQEQMALKEIVPYIVLEEVAPFPFVGNVGTHRAKVAAVNHNLAAGLNVPPFAHKLANLQCSLV